MASILIYSIGIPNRLGRDHVHNYGPLVRCVLTCALWFLAVDSSSLQLPRQIVAGGNCTRVNYDRQEQQTIPLWTLSYSITPPLRTALNCINLCVIFVHIYGFLFMVFGIWFIPKMYEWFHAIHLSQKIATSVDESYNGCKRVCNIIIITQCVVTIIFISALVPD